MLPLMVSVRVGTGCSSAGAQQALAQSCDQVTLALWQLVVEAVDGFDDDPPLSQAGDGAQRIQPGFELDRNPNAELWVIFYLFAVFGARRRAAHWTPVFHFTVAVVGHSRVSLPNNQQ